jgi:hypothetical protein
MLTRKFGASATSSTLWLSFLLIAAAIAVGVFVNLPAVVVFGMTVKAWLVSILGGGGVLYFVLCIIAAGSTPKSNWG